MKHKHIKNSKPVDYFISVAKDLNSELPRTNPGGGQSGTLNSRALDYQSSALTSRPCHLLQRMEKTTICLFKGEVSRIEQLKHVLTSL